MFFCHSADIKNTEIKRFQMKNVGDVFVREYDDPKYFMSMIMYLNFKNTLERLGLVKPLNISIF